ncbi:MAG: MFS transporter [Sphingomicrobium sp.]
MTITHDDHMPGEAPLRWVIVAALLVAYMLSFIDRQLINLLVDDLRRGFNVSDTRIGLLQGPAFGLFYAVLGLPCGWLADRVNRIRLIAAAIMLWTVMTILGGLSTSYAMLFVTRMGVGVGEAALVPAAVSLLADSFSPDRRALPLAIFTAGVSAGAGLALVVGGALLGLARAGVGHWPLIGGFLGQHEPWQVVLILAGLIGIPLALAIVVLPEPRRVIAPGPGDSRGLFRYLAAHPRLFGRLLGGASILYIFSYALAAWLPSLFVRGFGWSAPTTGARLGLTILVGALVGNLVSGGIATRLARLGRPNATLLTMTAGSLLLAPLGIAGPLAATADLAQFAVLLIYFAMALCFGIATAAFVAVTPAHLRGRMIALYLLLGNLFGLCIGPPAVGLILAWLGDPSRVGIALSLIAAATILIGARLLVSALRPHAIVAAALLASGCATIPPAVSLDVPAMVGIEPGSFIAGSTAAETDAVHYPALNAAREQPRRLVTIARPFAIGRTEVTRGQFARFVRATGWKPDGPCSFLSAGPGGKYLADSAHDWRHPGFAQTDAHPVVCINLADATAYAAWLSAATGRHFRLPSNTEWEYAARAGTTTARYWDEMPGADPCAFANLNDASSAAVHLAPGADRGGYFACTDGFATTAPVASFRPNAWGLNDVIGNVWELTADCLNDNQVSAPTDASARTTGTCTSHIDRGSSWGNTPKYVRVAAQHPDLVGARTAVMGFRLVEDLPGVR